MPTAKKTSNNVALMAVGPGKEQLQPAKGVATGLHDETGARTMQTKAQPLHDGESQILLR